MKITEKKEIFNILNRVFERPKPFFTSGDVDDILIIKNDFAIDFHQWMRVNETKENAEKYFHYTDKDMLNAFKEEQGL